MIQKLIFEGFKSLLADEIELGALTLLTGINSSGKSSVIQAVRMLERVKQGINPPMLPGHGTLDELINPYSQKFIIEAITHRSRVRLEYSPVIESLEGIDLEYPSITYIAAERFGPESFLEIYPGRDFRLGSKGENVFKCIDWHDTNSTNLPDNVKHPNSQGTTFSYNLEAWLGVISPNHGFKAQVQELSDTSYGTFNNRRARNVGFGLSYVLPVIVALLQSTVNEGNLVIIENPEAHLHPKGQTEMANLISKCVESGSQVIIETHSDHVFDGVRVYAKESESGFHKIIKAYWFELDDNLNSVVEEIEIDQNGRISNSPKGLFDQFEINAKRLL